MNKNNTLDSLWYCLEELCQVPTTADLKLLSGLLEEEIQRLNNAWGGLSVDARRELVGSLVPLTAADFELDFSAIFRLAMTDADAHVRASAIDGLIEDEDVRLVPQLARVLAEDTASAVRAAAAAALAQFVLLGELKKIRPRPFNSACAALIKAHTDPNEDIIVRGCAIEALGYTSAEGVSEMIEAAYAHPDRRLRTSAVCAMGHSADKRWAAITQMELNSPFPEMRYEATRACGELGLTEAVPALVELAEDVNPRIQEVALWSLGQIGGNLARRTLQRYLRTESAALRQAAQAALDELEFFHGDLSTFFGPPGDYDGASDSGWDEDDALDVDLDEDELEEDELEDIIFEGLIEDDEEDDEFWV